jgi:DNA-binding NarL/FixJ family response regulator
MTERSFYGYLEDTRHTPEPVRREPSPAELRVLRCLAHGMNVPMAAEAIVVSTYTAAGHVKSARTRMAAKTAAHAVAICLRNGWLT